jgi:hypothetical protein
LTPTRSTGSCLCGQVEFAVTGPPLVTFACHCAGCRKLTSAPFSLSSLYPGDRFELTRGETVQGGLHGEHTQLYCPNCKTWLFTYPGGSDAFVNVRSTLLEDAERHPPFLDINRAEALPFGSSGAVEAHDTVPQDSAWPEVMRRYAQWDAEAAKRDGA